MWGWKLRGDAGRKWLGRTAIGECICYMRCACGLQGPLSSGFMKNVSIVCLKLLERYVYSSRVEKGPGIVLLVRAQQPRQQAVLCMRSNDYIWNAAVHTILYIIQHSCVSGAPYAAKPTA